MSLPGSTASHCRPRPWCYRTLCKRL